jgi:hypothetical protein
VSCGTIEPLIIAKPFDVYSLDTSQAAAATPDDVVSSFESPVARRTFAIIVQDLAHNGRGDFHFFGALRHNVPMRTGSLLFICLPKNLV